MANILADFAQQGWLNMVGGCCGSTPAHIAAVAAKVKASTPRGINNATPVMRLSGLEPLHIS
jgi:5-methyltetrahydrofolate--homocysteine methyltransferase